MGKIIDRILEITPIPIVLAIGILILSVVLIKEAVALPSYFAALKTPVFQIAGLSVCLLLIAYYGVMLILRTAEEPKFGVHQRGVLVARFKDDEADTVQSHLVAGLKTAVFNKPEFSDVEVRSIPRVLADEELALTACSQANAVLCLRGVFVKPTTAHYIISSPSEIIARLLVTEFTDISSVQSQVLQVLGSTKPRTKSPDSNLAFLERALAEEKEAREQVSFELIKLRDMLNKRPILAPDKEAETPIKQLRALVVGVADYQHLPNLQFSSADASDIAETLKRKQAIVSLILNPTAQELRSNILETAAASNADEQLWFYFSGHGALLEGNAALIPTDGDPNDFEKTTIPASFVAETFKNSAGEQGLIVLDAGFVGERPQRHPQNLDLSPIQPIASDKTIAVMSAARLGEPVFVDSSSKNSVFTEALLRALSDHDGLSQATPSTVSRLFDDINISLATTNFGKLGQQPILSVNNPSSDIVLPKGGHL